MQFGSDKCTKIHTGKEYDQYKCLPLYVESWKEKDMEFNSKCESCGKWNSSQKNMGAPVSAHSKKVDFKSDNCENILSEVGVLKEHELEKSSEAVGINIVDICEGEEEMELKEEEKYLGEIISKDGRNLKNIRARVNKGIGIMKNILNLLDGIPFGKFYYEVAIILRNSLFVSSVLYNSEVWYNLTNAELDLLETADIFLLRGILKAPKSTPKEMLFLELGILPLREIIRKRRLGFLHYILQQKSDSLIRKVFEAQNKYPTSKDWVTMVKNDLTVIDMKTTFKEIELMKKNEFMNIVRRKLEHKSLKDLNTMKENHSKVRHLEHPVLKMQNYLMPNESNLKLKDIQLIFSLRCRTTDVKMNKKSQHETYECRACGIEDESQIHIISCKSSIMKMTKS